MAKGQSPTTKAATGRLQQQYEFGITFTTICAVTLLLLANVNSLGGGAGGGVDALSMALIGNGNARLQQPAPETSQQQLMAQQQERQDQQQQQQQKQQQSEPLQHPSQEEEESQQVAGQDDNNYVGLKTSAELLPPNAMLGEDNIGHPLNLGTPFKSLALTKRAPGGFVGMRGKKDNDDSFVDGEFLGYNLPEIDGARDCQDVVPEYSGLPWDRMSDYLLDLGQRQEYANSNVRRYKKAPTAFYGVRGKKFTIGNGVNPTGDIYRWNQFLEKLDEERVRDMIMDNFMDSLLESNAADNVPSEMTKRAPTGFTGVRGKRGIGNAFVGVRGKKDTFDHLAFKRSPAGGSERYFFDFWKKSSALSGGGGKRQRFLDFGNKFVAVRGKKGSAYADDLTSPRLAAEWTNLNSIDSNNRRWPEAVLSQPWLQPGSDASMRLLYGSTGKRAPSGFMGMRGKRPSAADEDDM